MPLPAGEVLAFSPEVIQYEAYWGTGPEVAGQPTVSIYIPPGAHLRFSSQVTCNRSIHLKVRSSGEGATFYGQKSSRMFELLSGCSLSLHALHFVDGFADYGGAVRLNNASDLVMRDVSFTRCEAWKGGGAVHVHGSKNIRMEGVIFTECKAEGDAGAVWVDRSDDFSMSNASFVNCSSGKQAVLYIHGIKEPSVIRHSHFVGNVAGATPSALFFSSRAASSDSQVARLAESVIVNTTFLRNTAPGDVTIWAASPLTWHCPLGSWMPNVGQQFGDITGCKLCAEGHYGNATDLVTFDCSGPCWPGHYCPKGSNIPSRCPTGTRMPNRRAANELDCIQCAPGEYQDRTGQEDCLQCDPGSYSKDAGRPTCEPCSPGGYCEQAGANTPMVFQLCPAGTFNPLHGSNSITACKTCPSGTSRPERGAVRESDCKVCQAGTFVADAANQCALCQHPLYSREGSTMCDICKKDYYLIYSPNRSADNCRSCPADGAKCPNGTALENLTISQGFWRASNRSSKLTKCRKLGRGEKETGWIRCAGGVNTSANGDGLCDSTFKGPECQLCSADNHYLVDGYKCEKCDERTVAAGRLAGFALGIVTFCGLVAWAYSMQGWRQRRYIGPPLRLADRAIAWSMAIGLMAKAKILLGFYQVCIVLSTTYSARMPEEYTARFQEFSEAVAIDWTALFLPVQCVPFRLRLLTYTLSPVGLVALLMMTGVGIRVRRWLAAVERPRFRDVVRSGILDLTPPGLVLIFCFVPSVSAFIFRSWSCQAYVVSDLPDEDVELIKFMKQDPSVVCGSPAMPVWSVDRYSTRYGEDEEEHKDITDLAIFLLFVWPFGSLVLFSLLLGMCYKAMQTNTPTDLSRAASFLHKEYEVGWYWWEALELLRKIVLTGVVVLIPEERAFLRLVIATLICSCYAVGLAVATPFKRIEDDMLAVATNLVLLIVFLGAGWTTLFNVIEEQLSHERAELILGWPDDEVIIIIMMVLIGAALGIFLVGAIVAARRVAKVPTIRLVATKQAPELTLTKGMTWHLFLSHIWSVSVRREKEVAVRITRYLHN